MTRPILILSSLLTLAVAGCGGSDETPDTPASATAALAASAPPGAGPKHGPGQMFARADQNHDGKLQQNEVSPELWSHLSVADTNGDGAVTQDELRAAHEQGKLQRPGGRGKGERLFAHFDQNQDGKLEQNEVPAKVWSHISVADTNGDGAVTQDELRAAHEQGKIRRPEGRGRGPRG